MFLVFGSAQRHHAQDRAHARYPLLLRRSNICNKRSTTRWDGDVRNDGALQYQKLDHVFNVCIGADPCVFIYSAHAGHVSAEPQPPIINNPKKQKTECIAAMRNKRVHARAASKRNGPQKLLCVKGACCVCVYMMCRANPQRKKKQC